MDQIEHCRLLAKRFASMDGLKCEGNPEDAYNSADLRYWKMAEEAFYAHMGRFPEAGKEMGFHGWGNDPEAIVKNGFGSAEGEGEVPPPLSLEDRAVELAAGTQFAGASISEVFYNFQKTSEEGRQKLRADGRLDELFTLLEAWWYGKKI